MATTTQTITPSSTGNEASQPFTLKLPHHDPTYLPIHRFITIDGLLKSHANEKEQTPLICYPKSGASDFEEHTGQDLDRMTDAAVQYYLQNGLEPADPTAEKAPVVALLATTSFDYVISLFALNRLGITTLFLSTRLAAPAYARLLEMADCKTLIVPEANRGIVEEISKHRPGCQAVSLLQRHDYRDTSAPAFRRDNVDLAKEGRKMAWILHSSGSTGFPKPIFLSNLACLANFRKSFGLRAFCASPLFHSHGLMELGRAFYTRAPMYLGNHSMPVTSQNLVEAMVVAKPQQVSAVPYVLQLLAEKEEGVQTLVKTKLVLFGGSSCPDDLGNRLVAAGVNLVANYGSTEIGQIMTSFRPPGDTEWQYMRLYRPAADFTLMDEIAPGVFECVGLDGLPSKGPSNSKPPYSAKNPENSFRTSDLFTRHPDPKKSNYYKYLSRLDDRLTLVNGEKVLPIPIENSIRQDALVREAVIFGFQRTVPGLLVFRSIENGVDLSDDEFLEQIWPSVEAANLQAESFSRVPKELVVIKGAAVRYPRTDKGTFIRAQVYQQFAEDISKAYAAFESGPQITSNSTLLQLDVPALEQWLLTKFNDELEITLPDVESDIFSAGVDSLQTTRLWRSIKRELDLGEGGSSLSQNVVFDKGTVAQLARHLYQLRTGEEPAEAEDEVAVMNELIDRYSSFTNHFPARTTQPEKQVVLVTGATGNLGAFIVATLARDPSVSEVWSLVRASGPAAAGARLLQSLSNRNIDLSASEQAKLHAVPSDLGQADLGLHAKDIKHLLSNLTCVIHSAWAVNFNLGVRSFEQQHIRGTYNLINFCLRTSLPQPAKFFFCSSISAASGTPKPATIHEAHIEDLNHAQKTGYGRSKLVTERITRNAARKTGMHAQVLRIGQLSGDSQTASWNETEAIALMIRSALSTGCLPDLNENPSWLPVDTCATAISQLALGKADVDGELVYHLLNPSSFSFKKDLLPMLKLHPAMPKFEIVQPSEWLDRLAQSEQDVEKNPPVKLLDFWRKKYGGVLKEKKSGDVEEEPVGLTFETGRTRRDASVLDGVRDPVSEGLVARYVDVWMGRWRA
ncbi:Putative AMP-dependent synthetase/ligase, phosphopantetheine binding ACP domain, AMP-binding protein [Septoria linicola]|uniref:AMP-dependent synthetase/ligase, phosphopantetheine binding ACP domain, AMP-binding protein n=1 Tax=Septoria linicola TaxID=215465 RepID=A0A9Q9B195_9PEZI|nr:putative AMP-dependent synthetase/ligase, phosphopantetheine binding ACP domain, AMP-binding protein [Septoria linicola]USW54491.1 Putative AMP-dependent synthetase/ligase, phosphopantetheine binding ACP domain, AMP-binding protein [Septoria linicola]